MALMRLCGRNMKNTKEHERNLKKICWFPRGSLTKNCKKNGKRLGTEVERSGMYDIHAQTHSHTYMTYLCSWSIHHLFIHSFLVHPSTHSFLDHAFIYLFIQQFIHAFIHPFIPRVSIYALVYLFIYSFIHPFVH